MSTTITPNMSLTLPSPGTELDVWGTEINAALTFVDGHNHAPGAGAMVPAAGLNINSDLPFNNYNATGFRSLRLASQGSALALAADLGCLYNVAGNLYYNDGAGNQIQLTSGGALNAASLGAIGGDYATSTASESYSSTTKTFTFTQASGKAANLDVGQVTIREPGVSSANGITLQSPSGLGASLALTLPSGLPGATLPVTLSSAGVLAASSSLSITLLASTGVHVGGDYLQHTGSNPATTTGFSNALTPKNTPKAWATFRDQSSTVTVQDGFNIASIVRLSSTVIRVTFATAMANANYCVAFQATPLTAASPLILFTNNPFGTQSKTTGYFDIMAVRPAAPATAANMDTGDNQIDFQVFGEQ